MSEPVDARARVRTTLENAGLRVTDVHVFPERPYRWSVRLIAGETTESRIRKLKAVDVVRYWRLPGAPGEPDEYVVTVDQARPDPTRTRPRHPRRQGPPAVRGEQQ